MHSFKNYLSLILYSKIYSYKLLQTLQIIKSLILLPRVCWHVAEDRCKYLIEYQKLIFFGNFEIFYALD